MSPIVVYISGPISAFRYQEERKNVKEATLTWNVLRLEGFTPICPHWSWYAVQNDQLQLCHEEWMEVDLPVLERCDAVYRIEGPSKGADIECEHAEDLGIPVFRDLVGLLEWRDKEWEVY